jgi:5-methylcytosine-specific restriction enzyme A
MRLNRLAPRVATHRQARIPSPQAAPGATEMERGRAWMAKRERVALRYGYRCASCGLVLLPGRWECDHIIPREQGGSNDETNLQSLCAWTDESGRKRGCHADKTAAEAAERSKSGR